MARLYGRNVSVLVADDHPAIRKAIRDLLQEGGMRVVGEAANGVEAVQQCAHLCPHIVVLDISMPRLNGFQAARQIARLSPATKIIVLTAHTLEPCMREAFGAGSVAFVSKQHAAIGLLAAIDAALHGKTYVTGQWPA